jgi:hypothetical protein
MCHIPEGTVSLSDGVPPYFYCVSAFLEWEFPKHLIGKGGSTAWPPCSPGRFFLLMICKRYCLSKKCAKCQRAV